ncbi:MAG: OsmC family peroxiredoxin [Chloroflexota bacterium]
MPTRSANADWEGTVKDGSGNVELGIGTYPFSHKTRVVNEEQSQTATNPEELIAAAQAACYSMSLSVRLSGQGSPPEHIDTQCKVTLALSGLGMKISKITIICQARVSGMSEEDFQKHAQIAKENCPISNALAAVPIELQASLITD